MTWLARLKNQKAPATHATKPTKPPQGGFAGGFVGFVAYPQGDLENFDGAHQTVEGTDAASLPVAMEAAQRQNPGMPIAPAAIYEPSQAGVEVDAAGAALLGQKKIPNTPGTHATKPTKPGFVGFVAYPQGVSGNSHPARACRACTHRLPAGTCSQPVAAGLREHFGIVWPEPTHAATCPAHTTKPQAVKTWPHAPADDAELATMAQRQARFERLGLHHEEAARLAYKLLLRDREGDDRRLCLECAHLRGRPGAWRCPTPGGMGAPLVAQLQRCPSWGAP